MFREENFEQVFANKIGSHNVDLIKRFFIIPSPQTNNKQPTSNSNCRNKNLQILLQKNNQNFPGGFQAQRSSLSNVEGQKLREQIIVSSKKAPQQETSTFVLRLVNKIRNEQKKVAEEVQESINYCIEEETLNPEIVTQTEQGLENKTQSVPIHKRSSKTKVTSLPTVATSNSQAYSFQADLSNIEKRETIVKKDVTCRYKTFTPILNNKMSYCKLDDKDLKSGRYNMDEQKTSLEKSRKNTEKTKDVSASLSPKFVKPIERSPKGYLSYYKECKEFLENNHKNFLCDPLVKKNLVGISAKNYLVMNRQNMTIVAEKKSNEEIEIASLTKIMTCFLCILVCEKYGIDPKETITRVSDKAAELPGTSADLQAGDILSIYDLMHGLMLPSGNDASVAIAESIGKIILKNKKKPSKKTHYETFITHMNILSKEIGVEQVFQNSSGLPGNPNFSSPRAVTVLTAVALKNPIFCQIISCKEYEIEIKNERFGLTRKQTWVNTNKLLWKGFEGVKTGTTDTAGHCLMSCKGEFIISVFDCETLAKRFSESAKIYDQLCSPNISCSH